MSTEDKHTDDSKTNENQNTPVKKVKRQATQAELDHPLHGVKLATILEELVEYYGWKYLAKEVNINCFKHNPTIKVSLKFLRKMTWAKEHVEDIYMDMVKEDTYKKLKHKKNNTSN